MFQTGDYSIVADGGALSVQVNHLDVHQSSWIISSRFSLKRFLSVNLSAMLLLLCRIFNMPSQ